MSKKIAEGIQGLVMDIKIGNGAFMETLEEGHKLATLLHQKGNNFDDFLEKFPRTFLWKFCTLQALAWPSFPLHFLCISFVFPVYAMSPRGTII